MRRLALIATMVSLGCSGGAVAQECVSSAEPPEGWVFLPGMVVTSASMPDTERFICTACSPVVEVVLAAAPPRMPMPPSPSGLAWAEAAPSDHHQRAVSELLDNLRRAAPECTVTGHARRGANVGSLGVLPVDVQKICPGKREERQTNFLSYDGKCLYQTLAMWYGPPLDEANTQRLLRLVASVRFGR
jgi:hypothetical protein